MSALDHTEPWPWLIQDQTVPGVRRLSRQRFYQRNVMLKTNPAVSIGQSDD